MARRVTIIALTLCAAALAPATAGAQDPAPAPSPTATPTPTPTPTPEPLIRAGVTVAGVRVGGLTVAAAEARLDAVLGPLFERDVVVAVGHRRFGLDPARLRLRFRADRTARRALRAGEAAPVEPDGTLPRATADPAVSYRHKPLWRFVRRVARKLRVAPRDARLHMTTHHMVTRRSRKGRKLEVRLVVRALQKALVDPRAKRKVRRARKWVAPRVSTRDLRRRYPTVVTIDQSEFRLRLFKRLHYRRGYGVAVGMPAYPTPNGLFAIQSKQVNPTWTAPNSPWAGELAGQQISGGAWNNPLKARWMGVSGSVGIHGTGMPWTIGTRASHGCIRMGVPDVIDLFARVPIGTPVLIGP
jgi:L,D-transpeptidase catalytic domain/Putative peptidoglycan binding domain